MPIPRVTLPLDGRSPEAPVIFLLEEVLARIEHQDRPERGQ